MVYERKPEPWPCLLQVLEEWGQLLICHFFSYNYCNARFNLFKQICIVSKTLWLLCMVAIVSRGFEKVRHDPSQANGLRGQRGGRKWRPLEWRRWQESIGTQHVEPAAEVDHVFSLLCSGCWIWNHVLCCIEVGHQHVRFGMLCFVLARRMYEE